MMLSSLKKAIALIESQLPEGLEDVDVMVSVNLSEPKSITNGNLYSPKGHIKDSVVVLHG